MGKKRYQGKILTLDSQTLIVNGDSLTEVESKCERIYEMIAYTVIDVGVTGFVVSQRFAR